MSKSTRGQQPRGPLKKLLVLGGGTAGTMVVNKLSKKLRSDQWSITVVDQDNDHLYQPGLLLLPFGVYQAEELVKKRDRFFPSNVEFIRAEIEKVVPEANHVLLADGGARPARTGLACRTSGL